MGRDPRALGDGPASAAAAAARGLVASAPITIIAEAGDRAAEDVGAWLALRLRAPLLLDGPALPDGALDGLVTGRLGSTTVVRVGEVDAPGDVDVRSIGSPAVADAAALPAVRAWEVRLHRASTAARPPHGADVAAVDDLLEAARPARRRTRTPVLARRGDRAVFAAVVTARALGHRIVPSGSDDPRRDPRLRRAVSGLVVHRAVRIGDRGAWRGLVPGRFRWQLAVAHAGHLLPGGGQALFPGRRLVALYGAPGTGSLGVLGEQPVDAAITRARRLAETYRPHTRATVVPTFEIIATVASAYPGPDGDYSNEIPLDVLHDWVAAARGAGVHVVLDLQPGRTDFLTQARRLEPLLRQPHVGLALDPEWRLRPDERHLRQVGSVGAREVNAVARWLARLTRTQRLPQKLLLVHQFKLSMIRDRERLITPPELAVVIQMDGQGPQHTKLATWHAVTRTGHPRGVSWGWKNFYDEDAPVRSPADTLAVRPTPVFVSYQ